MCAERWWRLVQMVVKCCHLPCYHCLWLRFDWITSDASEGCQWSERIFWQLFGPGSRADAYLPSCPPALTLSSPHCAEFMATCPCETGLSALHLCLAVLPLCVHQVSTHTHAHNARVHAHAHAPTLAFFVGTQDSSLVKWCYFMLLLIFVESYYFLKTGDLNFL